MHFTVSDIVLSEAQRLILNGDAQLYGGLWIKKDLIMDESILILVIFSKKKKSMGD